MGMLSIELFSWTLQSVRSRFWFWIYHIIHMCFPLLYITLPKFDIYIIYRCQTWWFGKCISFKYGLGIYLNFQLCNTYQFHKILVWYHCITDIYPPKKSAPRCPPHRAHPSDRCRRYSRGYVRCQPIQTVESWKAGGPGVTPTSQLEAGSLISCEVAWIPVTSPKTITGFSELKKIMSVFVKFARCRVSWQIDMPKMRHFPGGDEMGKPRYKNRVFHVGVKYSSVRDPVSFQGFGGMVEL